MSLKNRIDAGGLPVFEMGGAETGVSPQRAAELSAAIAVLNDHLELVRAGVADVAAERAALLAWSQVAMRALDLVEASLPLFRREEQPEPERPDLRSQLLSGILGVWRQPKDSRGAALTALLQSLLGQAAG